MRSADDVSATHQGERPLPRVRVEWLWVVAMFATSRLLIFALMLFSKTVIVRGNFWHPGGLMAVLTQWDSGWYLSIVRGGYDFSTEHQSRMGFFPFFPLLVRLLNHIVRNAPLAGVITANACLCAAGLLFYQLVKLDSNDRRVPRRAVLFLMFSPVAFFFSSVYTESTFLMLVLGAFLAARKQRWLIACVLGGCASATRQVGLLIALPLLVEYLQPEHGQRLNLRKLFHPRILLFALVPAGFGLFMLYGQLRFHDPLAFFHATAVWGRKLTSPVVALSGWDHYPQFYRWLFFGTVVASAALWIVGLMFRVRPSYQVYAAVFLLVYISSNSLEAITRNVSVLFPLFLVMALLTTRFEWLYESLLSASIALLTICTVLYANGYWMT